MEEMEEMEEYRRNRYHNMSEEKKQRLKEHQKNYCDSKKSEKSLSLGISILIK